MTVEMIGYIGSALVLVSMLMTSVVRLRIINLAGSIIFSVYALLIHSYPTALMNIALAGINVFYLFRILGEQKIYHPIRCDRNDGYLSFLLERDIKDINEWFPEFKLEDDMADVAYLICCDSGPACVFLGKKEGDGALEILLDYATPEYRDTSVGKFLYRHLAKEGYESLFFRQNAEGHIPFLKKVGYRQTGDNEYTLDLTKLR